MKVGEDHVWRCNDCGEEQPAALGAESTDDVECDECGERCDLVDVTEDGGEDDGDDPTFFEVDE